MGVDGIKHRRNYGAEKENPSKALYSLLASRSSHAGGFVLGLNGCLHKGISALNLTFDPDTADCLF